MNETLKFFISRKGDRLQHGRQFSATNMMTDAFLNLPSPLKAYFSNIPSSDGHPPHQPPRHPPAVLFVSPPRSKFMVRLRKFWKIEEVSPPKAQGPEHTALDPFFLWRRTAETGDGLFVIHHPLKTPPSVLEANHIIIKFYEVGYFWRSYNKVWVISMGTELWG